MSRISVYAGVIFSMLASAAFAQPRPQVVAPVKSPPAPAVIVTPAPDPTRLVGTPEKSRSTRPPMEVISFDIGRYAAVEALGGKPFRFVSPDRELEANVGATFGYSWQIKGFSGTRLLPIRNVVTIMRTASDGTKQAKIQSDEKIFLKPVNGELTLPFFYRIDTVEESINGEWTLTVYYDTQLVAEHSFTLTPAKKKE